MQGHRPPRRSGEALDVVDLQAAKTPSSEFEGGRPNAREVRLASGFGKIRVSEPTKQYLQHDVRLGPNRNLVDSPRRRSVQRGDAALGADTEAADVNDPDIASTAGIPQCPAQFRPQIVAAFGSEPAVLFLAAFAADQDYGSPGRGAGSRFGSFVHLPYVVPRLAD
jgi:hypothetical protein